MSGGSSTVFHVMAECVKMGGHLYEGQLFDNGISNHAGYEASHYVGAL